MRPGNGSQRGRFYVGWAVVYKSAYCCLVTKSCPTLLTPWTVAHQAPLSIGFSRQEYWSGLPFPSYWYGVPFPSPGALSNTKIEPASPVSPALLADSLTLSQLGSYALISLETV